MRDYKDIAEHFNPEDREEDIYKAWLADDCFRPERKPADKVYSLVMPPPNITGQLHMGHALDLSMQDILIRFKRMQGFETLYVPGTDHASIATEAKVVEKLRSEGRDKREMGREAFLKEAWAWNDKYGNRIAEQTKRLGISCDWSRQRFTLDEGLSEAVIEAFCSLYESGQIYRGERMINWCCDCETSISDAETEHLDTEGSFYHIKYPLKDFEGEFLEIATTRPETLLGDTAVAVHPKDERYQNLVGKTCILPIVGRELVIVADDYVDREFGTGCVKITPAHDPNDFELGERHDLEIVDVFTDDGKVNELGGKYEGLTIQECRKAIVEDLKDAGLFIRAENINHNVAYCTRCHSQIEPRLSLQWWVNMAGLAKDAIAEVDAGKIEFIPVHFKKIYLNWMKNIRDWCISRQLWWGHQIPAWYCADCEHITVARQTPKACENCGSTSIVQDEDSLDTWFSSALWPFSTMGWPEDTPDFKRYYPNQALITGYDILPLWVSRMIFSGIYYTGKVPFYQVAFHGLVRDEDGQKMSKSLGNGIDPLEVIAEVGSDSLRYALFKGSSVGKDMRFSRQKLEAGRNFMNKIWNAMRFFRMNLGDLKGLPSIEDIRREDLTDEDCWIIERLNNCIESASKNYEDFDYSLALDKIQTFAWDEFCDWYLEISKDRLRAKELSDKEQVLVIIKLCLETIVKLLHPVMPFFTEEVYAELAPRDGFLMLANWPEEITGDYNEPAERISEVIQAVRAIRNARAELKVELNKEIKAYVLSKKESIVENLKRSEMILRRLAKVSEVEKLINTDNLADYHAINLPEFSLYLPLKELIDKEAELKRLGKELKEIEQRITAQEKKLANEAFVSRAPAQVVEQERTKLKQYLALKEQCANNLKQIQSM